MSVTPSQGHSNYIVIPKITTDTFQQGKITVEITEDIAGIDGNTNTPEFDFQWNFFSSSGTWWQIIIEPNSSGTSGYWPNYFQLWRVVLPTQRYYTSAFPIGIQWANALYKKGTWMSLYWAGRQDKGILNMNSAFLEITNPEGIFDRWLIPFSDFGNLFSNDLVLNGNPYMTPPSCSGVFSITGSDGGSMFKATGGAGKIYYFGLVQDPLGIQGIQTAENSNFNYTPLQTDTLGNLFQTFAL